MSDPGVGALHRMTRQRTAILAALDTSGDFRSAQQWHDSMVASGTSIGLATVYRGLQSLAEAGEVDTVRSADGEALYRRCEDPRHHHHIRCRVCGAAVEIEGPGVEDWASRIGRQHGYSHVEHTIELIGLCQGCSTKEE